MIRKDTIKLVCIDGNQTFEDAIIYAATPQEARDVKTESLLMGSLLIVVSSGEAYMLDGDGGNWRSINDGTSL